MVSSLRIWVCGLAGTIFASAQPAAVSVPFVGCKSDGQAGPVEAPKDTSESVQIDRRASQQLAYYRSGAQEIGVLAPRGWYCYGAYGSGGGSLFVSPLPFDDADVFSRNWGGFSEPAIELSYSHGGGSGRFEVAKVVARVFPAYKAIAAAVMEEFPTNPFPFGPYPTDKLTYRSKSVVEYRTPAQTEGLGTHSRLKKIGSPIEGVAILNGEDTPDLLLLSVRLPAGQTGLASAVIHQVEADAARQPRR